MAARPTAYFTFGRFQPPTIGHVALIDAIIKRAAAAGGDAFIFVSATYDATIKPLKKGSTLKNYLQKYRNPIPVGDKVAALREMFADEAVTIESRNIVPAIYSLANSYKEIVMIVGSDRVEDFGGLIKSLQGKLAGQGVTLRIEGVKRNATNRSTSLAPHLMSGTKARSFVIKGNTESFRHGVHYGKITNNSIKKLYNSVKRHYNNIMRLEPITENMSNKPPKRLTGKRRASLSPSKIGNKSVGRLTLKNSPKKSRPEAASPNKSPSAAKDASAISNNSP